MKMKCITKEQVKIFCQKYKREIGCAVIFIVGFLFGWFGCKQYINHQIRSVFNEAKGSIQGTLKSLRSESSDYDMSK